MEEFWPFINQALVGKNKKQVKNKQLIEYPFKGLSSERRIRIDKKRIGVDLKKLADKTGLKVVEGFPIPEFRENQVVGRHIVVFSK